ncbi:MAG: NYN domain-containing protein [Parcubacteria group bacterium]|nr:NYN domain-containing protein [Parcubacteria group bacterium]
MHTLGSVAYLEHVLSMKKKGLGREMKLPGVLVYLHSISLGNRVPRAQLSPFFENPARYEFLFALDAKEKSKIPFNGSCLKVRYETDVIDRRHGGKIEYVELIQGNIVAALKVACTALSLSWTQMLTLLECTEEDIQAIQKKKLSGSAGFNKEVVASTKPFKPNLFQSDTPAHFAVTEVQMDFIALHESDRNRAVLSNLRPIASHRGSGEEARRKNLSALLEELCRIAILGVVEEKQLGRYKVAYRAYLIDLNDRGCIQLVYDLEGRGRQSIQRVKILRNDIPKKYVSFPKKPEQKPVGLLQVPDGFQLVRTETLKDLKKRAEKKDERSTEPITFIFVDVGNLTGAREGVDGDGKECGRRILSIQNLNWHALRLAIMQEPSARERIQGLYAYVWTGVLASDVEFNAKQEGFTIIRHPKKDTDVVMSGDIGFFVRDAMEKYTTVHVILVTGDGDYNHTLHHLRHAARETNTKLTIAFIAQHGHLNQKSHNMADSVLFVEPKHLTVFQKNHQRVHGYGARFGRMTRTQ